MNLYRWFLKCASWPKVIVLLVASNVIYFIMIRVTIPNVSNMAEGMKVFDLMPLGYDVDYAMKLLEALGEEGRNIYLLQQIPLDLVYPGLLGLSGAFLIARMTRNHNKMSLALFIPLIAATFDYLENMLVAYMLVRYPDVNALTIKSSSFFTMGKSLITTIFFLFVILYLVAALIISIKHKLKGEENTDIGDMNGKEIFTSREEENSN
ncbi:hypothetical protein [Bacillus solimangrovi]|uniref:Uncharacterized protein n=1 Tax=Bacillus solimangrovi TaxID=1305675 RepID=A0A1E5LEH1_9BACI|nr:hypothetical protein [Bacillus solimangrovi]OEH92459.1 hypothetical protein BFG57_15890 [Bacillus solimangrovi]